MMDAALNAEILRRLAHGRPLEGLGLGVRDGRVDVRGLIMPEPIPGKPVRLAVADVVALEGQVIFRQVAWESLDFSGCRLNGLRFFDCTLTDCIFDGCHCQDWRLWRTVIAQSRFHGAGLRQAALGGVLEGQRNSFRSVDFSNADLRQTAFVSAEFAGCTFRHTRLKKVNFGGSSFTDCTFEGELREVCFNRTAFRQEALPPNEMSGVDFSRAKLRFVEFRGLDLTNVRFPNDEEHIVLREYPVTLDRLLRTLKAQSDTPSKALAAGLDVLRKWAGRNQQQGVLNRKDLVEIAGEEAASRLLELLRA